MNGPRYFLVQIGTTASPDGVQRRLDPPVRADVAEIGYAQGARLGDALEPEGWTLGSAGSIPVAVAVALEGLLR